MEHRLSIEERLDRVEAALGIDPPPPATEEEKRRGRERVGIYSQMAVAFIEGRDIPSQLRESLNDLEDSSHVG